MTMHPTETAADTVASEHDEVRRHAALANHPAGRGRRLEAVVAPPRYPASWGSVPTGASPVTSGVRRFDDEDGSLVTEYGLLAVVAATVAGVVIQWASGGALVTLFNALLRHARSLVGA